MNGSNFNPRLIQEKCQKAGISYWITSEVIMAISERVKPGMTEDEIDDLVIEELRKRDEASARAYENFHRIYVRTSSGELEPFDKDKIVSSLLKETTIPRGVCEEIANEVESDIRRLELRYVSTSLIRDIVNSKLLERKYSKARLEYSRLGLPLYDVHRIIEDARIKPRNPEAIHKVFGDAIASEYALVKVLPDEIAKAHLSGFIHVHDLPYLATRITSLQNDLRWFIQNGLFIDEDTVIAGPPRHCDTLFSHIIRILISASTHISGGQGFDFFNLFVSPFTINLKDNQLRQLVQGFLYEINQLYGVNGGRLALATLNFELEVPSFIKKEKAVMPGGITSTDTYLDYEREMIRVLNTFLNVMSEGDYKGNPFRTPRLVLKIRDGPIPESTLGNLENYLERGNPVLIVNHRRKEIRENAGLVAPNHMLVGKREKWFETLRTGILQEVSINMPYIGLKARDESEFFSLLERSLDYAKEVVKIKKELTEKNLYKTRILPFLAQEVEGESYFQLEYAPSLVNLVGLESAVHAFKGVEINKSEEGYLFAEKVLSFVSSKLENYLENDGLYMTLANLEAERVRERFARLNLKNFGVKDVYYGTYSSGFQNLIQTMRIESDLQSRSLGGTYMEVSLARFAEEQGKKPSIRLVYDILDHAPISFRLVK